jgi:hypothetical protein
MGESRTFDGLKWEVGDQVVCTGSLWANGEVTNGFDDLIGQKGVITSFFDAHESSCGSISVKFHNDTRTLWLKHGVNVKLAIDCVPRPTAWTAKRKLKLND